MRWRNGRADCVLRVNRRVEVIKVEPLRGIFVRRKTETISAKRYVTTLVAKPKVC